MIGIRDYMAWLMAAAQFGQWMHEHALREWMQQQYPNTEFDFHTGPGETGPDVTYKGGEYPGFDQGDLKPFTPSGSDRLDGQIEKWGPTQPFWYDYDGNIWKDPNPPRG